LTYFKLVIGYDCGLDKSTCQLGYPENCVNCLLKSFSDAHFLIDIIEATEQYSEEKRKSMVCKHIWRKYQDISSIRHVIIINRAGLPAFNMAIGDLPIDATLISGFIQANVSFSFQELTMIDRINPEKKIYELEYKNFHILLCNGNSCRVCLILDKKASNSLRELLSSFTDVFEENYEEQLKEFETRGDLDILKPVRDLVSKIFEISMLYPLRFSSQIPPDAIKNLSLVQKAIYECAKDMLKEETYFYINPLIDIISKLLGVIPKEEILWNIRQLMKENIILQNFEFQKKELKDTKKKKEENENIIQKLMEMKDLEDIIFESHQMTPDEALLKIDSLIKKGDIAEKNDAYQEALNEYQTALNYAKEFFLEEKMNEISSKILEIVKINKEVELNYAILQANRAEWKKDYVIALKYLFLINDALSAENRGGIHDKELNKINKKIKKIQKHFQ